MSIISNNIKAINKVPDSSFVQVPDEIDSPFCAVDRANLLSLTGAIEFE